MVEFSWRMGLYEAYEDMSPKFAMFLQEVARDYEGEASGIEFWGNIMSGVFNSGVSRESSIKSPIHRLIHRIINLSIHHKRHGDKVTKLNLFFLWAILKPGCVATSRTFWPAT